MSTLHRHPKSPYWYCAYRSSDSKQHYKSTGTTNKTEAEIICKRLGEAGRAARKRKLTPQLARRILESALDELLRQSQFEMPGSGIREFCKQWIKEKQDSCSDGTFQRYDGIVDRFLKFLGPRANDSIGTLTKQDIQSFRESLEDSVSAGTVNTYLKVVRVMLGRAVKEELIEKNPAALVDTIRNTARNERRAFTVGELKKLLEVADADWRTMILFGLYTGLRLSDIAGLDWEHLDLKRQEMTVTTGKTGRTVILPLASPLLKHIGTLPAGDDPSSPLCPTLAGKGSSWLSNQFYDLMARAKLVDARSHQESKLAPGRSKRRKLQPISFHALRHTATSLLKNAGISSAVVMDIIGHDSEAISRNYTHIETETKRRALDAMPDVS